MDKLIKDLEQRKKKALMMGGQAKIERQHSLGHYTARERIDRFLDADTFMELGMLNHSDDPGMDERGLGDGRYTPTSPDRWMYLPTVTTIVWRS